jgi:glycosyltransferase involved in cell wall biosynthesis
MTHRSKKIAIVLPDLRGGGAERMHLSLARDWMAHGFEVDFVLLRANGQLLEIVPKMAQVIDLEVLRFRNTIAPLRSYIRQQRPAVLLVAMWPLTVVAIIAARLSGTGVRTVVSDHSPLSLSYSQKGLAHRALLRASLAVTYPLADMRIAVSKGVAADLSNLSGINLDQFRVIYNPAAAGDTVPVESDVPVVPIDITGRLILAVGTLKAVKDYPLLIEAFSQLAAGSDATLCILGEGALRGELEQLVARLGLLGRVLLPGFMLETGPWYERADLFVLSSRHEGFGNVIVEALEHGVPVVSTDCPSGPRKILCDGKYGKLVPVGDADALAKAINDALVESPNRDALKARARDFSVKTISRQYLDVMFPEESVGTSG